MGLMGGGHRTPSSSPGRPQVVSDLKKSPTMTSIWSCGAVVLRRYSRAAFWAEGEISSPTTRRVGLARAATA